MEWGMTRRVRGGDGVVSTSDQVGSGGSTPWLRRGPLVGELQRSTTVPGFAWRDVVWSGLPIGILSETEAGRRVGVCTYPCMYRTPESLSDRGAAMFLVAHRQSMAHRLIGELPPG
jgi:hypothetical protein